MRSEVLEAAGRYGESLRVEFLWRGDRYGHVISAADDAGDFVPLLESLEGTPADDFPPSPPLQNLHRETLPGGRPALLLVGAAGRSHWSASVEAQDAGLSFDFACRHSGPASWLGCRYRTFSGAKSRLSIDAEGCRIACQENEVEICARAGASATARWRFTVSVRP